MSTQPRFAGHTVADYRDWAGDWELIRGRAVVMGPSPFGPHERSVSRLSYLIQRELRRHDCRCEVYTNLDWIVAADTVIRPDLMVVCGDQPNQHLERPPEMIVEVLSPATRELDQTVKREIARERGVPHYCVVDPDTRQFAVARDSCWDSVGDDGDALFSLGGGCAIRLRPRDLFDPID